MLNDFEVTRNHPPAPPAEAGQLVPRQQKALSDSGLHALTPLPPSLLKQRGGNYLCNVLYICDLL